MATKRTRQVLSVRQVAACLNATPREVLRLFVEGRIDCYRFIDAPGRGLYVLREDLEHFMADAKVDPGDVHVARELEREREIA